MSTPPNPLPPPGPDDTIVPGSIYDTNLTNTPLPPQPPQPPTIYDTGLANTPLPPPGSVYDTGLTNTPLPPVPPPPTIYDTGLANTPLPPPGPQAPGSIYDTNLSNHPLPQYSADQSQGSVYDARLVNTPLGPQPSYGAVYDAGLASTPLPGPHQQTMYNTAMLSGPPQPVAPVPWHTTPAVPHSTETQLVTAFVSNLRAEIRQLEGYFARQTRRFRLFGLATLLCAASVPVLVAAQVWPWLVAVLGAIAAISGSVQTLYRFQDSALSAMSLANRLEAELVRFETGTAPYAPGPREQNFNSLVDRVTTLREEASAGFAGVWSNASARG